MTAARSARPAVPPAARLPLAAALALAVTLGVGPAAYAQGRARAGYGPSVGERLAAARLAQRERDAARRRSSGYSFGNFGPGDRTRVPRAAFDEPGGGGQTRGPVTRVRVIVLVDGAGGVLAARQWREALAALEIDASIRTARPLDELGAAEQTGGGLRTVTATGRLTDDGALAFGDRRFEPGDRRGLAAWAAALETHGAAGDPAGQPLWGLSGAQFREVFEALAAPAPAGFAAAGGGTAGAALSALDLPPNLPVAISDEAAARLAAPAADGAHAAGGALPALSKGTAMAVALARRGLAFRPTRTPAGSLELTIVPRPAADAPVPVPGTGATPGGEPAEPVGAWPVGWRPAAGPARVAAAPGMFSLATVGVPEGPLTAFAAAVERASGVPVVLDESALRAAGVDPARAMVSVPAGRSTWLKAVRFAVAEHRLQSELRQDEAGRGFLWVTPIKR